MFLVLVSRVAAKSGKTFPSMEAPLKFVKSGYLTAGYILKIQGVDLETRIHRRVDSIWKEILQSIC